MNPFKPAHPLLLAALAAAFSSAHADTVQLKPVEVIGTTPLPGLGVPRDQLPANVQTLPAAALTEDGNAALPNTLAARLPSVNVNEVQGNPWQADLNYRGFTASPLLGTAQGLSVYVDGVRANEGFGDVVNWELLPDNAIADLTLLPGSNPLFGLNTLGGALSVHTKRGDTHPGGEIGLSFGSFGRRQLDAEYGFAAGNLHGFFAASAAREDGWRDHSPSDLARFFGKLGWKDARSDLSLSLAHGSADLTGNGLLPESMLARDRDSIFTHPDNTRNRASQLALNASHWLTEQDQLAASAYFRRTRTRTLNGDANDDFEDGPFDGISSEESGAENRTGTDQHAAGLALQWTALRGNHQIVLGASHDRSHAGFNQWSAEGELTPSRGVEAEEEPELENSLSGWTRTTSLFIADTWSLTDTLQLSASARYNHTRVINNDRLSDTYPNLDGNFSYDKLNPALGLTWQSSPALTLYGGYSQGNRAPTPIELGCADPENPCTLPNALAADPFLEQVVTRTLEFGARGRLGQALHWNAGAYRSVNHDDILFVGTSTSAGYFTNFGKTRRQGIELGLGGSHGTLDWQLNYNWLDATFQSSACLLAENNSSAGSDEACGEDEIRVKRGDRLPALPEHALKLATRWQATPALRLGADLAAYSSQRVRGNENGQHEADEEFGGSGEIGGYTLVNLNLDYRLNRDWTLFGRVNNLFDKRYATAGALAENPFDSSGAFQVDSEDWSHEQFVAPGAPRALWVGVKYAWGR